MTFLGGSGIWTENYEKLMVGETCWIAGDFVNGLNGTAWNNCFKLKSEKFALAK